MLGLGRLLPGWLLSEAEVDYLKRGVALGVRDDGRAAMQLRRVEVNTSVLPHSHGSARVAHKASSPCGEVIAGVKFDVQVVDEMTASSSCLFVTVDCSQVVPGEKGRRQRDVEGELADALKTTLELGGGFAPDSPPMVIAPNALCWSVHLHVTVVQFGGNLFDTLMLASYAALQNAKVPAISAAETTSPETAKTEGASDRYFQVDADAHAAVPFDCSMCPISATLSRIGGALVADALPKEEVCASAQICVAATLPKDGEDEAATKIQVCGVLKDGTGSIKPEALLAALLASENIIADRFAALLANNE